jgi:hypothetical protein
MINSQIKITKNVYNEFSSMIQTCANIPEEDNEFDGLFTALDNSNFSKGYHIVELNPVQVKQLIHFSRKQIEYLAGTTIPELNYDGNYKEASACRYTIKGLQKLINSLEEKAVVQ